MSDKHALVPGVAAIAPRSHALARVLKKEIIQHRGHETLDQLIELESKHGFEYALRWLLGRSIVWQKDPLCTALRSFAHLYRRPEQLDFLGLLINHEVDVAYISRKLYNRGHSFLRVVSHLSGARLCLQIDFPAVCYCAQSETIIVLASREQVVTYERASGKQKGAFDIQECRGLSISGDTIFVAAHDGLWRLQKDSNTRQTEVSIDLLTSFAGRTAVLETSGRLSVLEEEFCFTLPQDSYSVMALSIRGLSVALGTEEGRLHIIGENDGLHTSVFCAKAAITALCWDQIGGVYVGDDEGNIFYWCSELGVELLRHYSSSIMSVACDSKGLRLVLSRCEF